MRLAWLLMVIGGFLILDGLILIVPAIISSNFSGVIIGLLLGGGLFWEGLKRFKKYKRVTGE